MSADDLIVEEPFDTIPGVSLDEPSARSGMKLVWCITRPESLDTVKDAVAALGVVGGMTITDVRGFGRQKGKVEHYRGGEYTIRFVPKVKIEIAVRDEDVAPVMAAVSRAARTGQVGDGKLFVVDITSVVRIRTGDRGAIAL